MRGSVHGKTSSPRQSTKRANRDVGLNWVGEGWIATGAALALKPTPVEWSFRAKTGSTVDELSIISASGVTMPRLIYGTAWKKERTAALAALALRSGFRGIDTACQPKHYFEPGVGAALEIAAGEGISRSEIYVQTKFSPLPGQDPEDIPYDPKASVGEQVLQSFEASLRNLRINYLDSLVLHSPYREEADTQEAWAAMEALHDQGRVRQLGISNCYDFARFKALWQTARIKPATIQNRFYKKTGYDKEIRAFCREKNIIYQSFWTLTANPEILAAPAMAELAQNHGRTPAQVFFRYLTQLDVACLTGTKSADHMAQDLGIFEFRLSPGECEAIGALLDAEAPISP
jgi:diketogulonate reductase-like aldo/keto reductase